MISTDTELEDELGRLIAATYTGHEGLLDRVDALVKRAAELGSERYVALAEMVRADVYNRSGRSTEAARIAQGLLESTTDRLVAARAHAIISGGLWRLGETAESASHAEKAFSMLTDDDPLCLRADAALVLAAQVCGYRVGGTQVTMFQHAQDLADRLGLPAMQVSNLNNWAWVQYERGELADAVALVTRMRRLAERAGYRLNSSCIDTLARILLESGDAEQAERVILTALDGFAADTESDAIPSCLITLADLQRRRGDLPAAIASLTRSREMGVRNRMAEVAARALRELAAGQAATGDFRSAYEHMVAFHHEWTRLRSQQGEAASAVVQAVFDIEQARRSSREFQRLAERDPLTGLWNRRKCEQHLRELLAAPPATRPPLSVAILDLDHFKRVNDRHSHETGDRVLCAVGQILRDTAGEGRAVRLGGEEFLLILPLDGPAAAAHCERVRRVVAGHDWSAVVPGLRVTTSAGVTAAGAGDEYTDLLRRADRHLYAAKHRGRNRVVAD